MRRDEKTSTAKVTFRSGASVPSIMFTARGFYDMARARRAPCLITLKEWRDSDNAWMYLVGFSHDKGVDPQKYFGLAEPASEKEFMAVVDLDVVFRPWWRLW